MASQIVEKAKKNDSVSPKVWDNEFGSIVAGRCVLEYFWIVFCRILRVKTH